MDNKPVGVVLFGISGHLFGDEGLDQNLLHNGNLFKQTFNHLVGAVHEDEGVAIQDVVSAEVRSDHHPVLGEGFGCSRIHASFGRRQNHQGLSLFAELESIASSQQEALRLRSIHLDGLRPPLMDFILGLVAQRATPSQLLHLVVQLLCV